MAAPEPRRRPKRRREDGGARVEEEFKNKKPLQTTQGREVIYIISLAS
jgi:hypothetical protein